MKKTLALILALSLVLGAMSGIAFAAEVVVTDEAGLLAAVANDGEITLGGNITLSQTVVIPENVTVVLDLKGYAITMEDSIKTTTYAFNNLGNLTIKDTVGSGSVSARGIYNGYGNGADNVEDAVITILGGTYNALGTNGGAAIFNYGKANINGGSFTSIGGYTFNSQAGSSMTIAAGVTANNGIYASNATLVINGGEIEGNRSGCHVVYSWNSDVTINGGSFYNYNSGNATVMFEGTTKAVINGGTFGIKDGRVPGNGNTWTSCLTDTKGSASLVVNGGTFNGGFRVLANTTMTINGGTYNDCYGSSYNIYGTVVVNAGAFEDAAAKNFADKYKAESSEFDANTGVVVQNVAKIGNTYYKTLQAAVNAVNEGETIYLISTVNEGSVKLPAVLKNITIDGNNTAVVKNTTINAFDGSSVDYQGFTVKNTTFENSRFNLSGYRSTAIYKDIVFNNNKFLNIVASQNMAAVHMNLRAGETLENFTFTNNIIDGVSGSSNSGIVIKQLYGDVVISNNTITDVAWNAIQCWYNNGANIAITNNTLSAGADEGVINLNGVDAVALKNNTITTKKGQPELAYFGAAAKIGDVYYNTLADAIAAANSGDTIDLLGNKVVLKDIPALAPNNVRWFNTDGKTLTIENGTFDLTGANVSDSVFRFTAADTHIVFNNVDFVKGEDGYVLYFVNLHDSSTSVKFNDCDFDIAGGFKSFIANTSGGAIEVIDADVKVEGGNFIYRGGALVKNVTFKSETGNVINHNAYPSAIDNSKIITKRLGFIAKEGTMAITNGSAITAKEVAHYHPAGDANYTAGLITVDATSTLEADEIDMGLINDASEGKVTSEASSIYVQYKKTDLDANGDDNLEGADTYELVLVGANNAATEEIINELASADLTFEFVGTPVTGGAMDYTVAPATGVTLTQLGDRFMFNYDGATKYEESGKAIVIGTIRIDGYGTYTFGTKSVETNAVYATEIRDNIVDGYDPAAGLVINRDFKADDGMVGNITNGAIAVPTRELTINIAFPNAVEDNEIAYQDMKVEITGNIDGVNKTVTYNLGEDEIAMGGGKYVVTNEDLVLNNAYTVTVSGAGYRTARYTVTMTNDKELNFWNNVMDEEKVVEVGKDTSKTIKNFLAGDIVKDNQINIYDLSAVVSYFASTSDVANGYAKYDLNRDGVIDSKDVAYVLVSWNN